MRYRFLDTSKAREIAETYKVGSLTSKVACSFAESPAQLASFFHPSTDFQFAEPAYRQAVELLKQTKEENIRAFIFGDYDCDGLCATAMMAMILEKLGIDYGYYVPDRTAEGYGLNMEKLQLAYQKGYRLLITVDNGVAAKEPLRWAREQGMKILLSDHHQITQEFDCDVLLHPSVLNEEKACLCGSGVVYGLACALNLQNDDMAILCALATIGDVMNLNDLNVQLVRQGLKALNKGNYQPILQLDNFTSEIDETVCSHLIIPKINAVGRMEGFEGKTLLHAYEVVAHLLKRKNLSQTIAEINTIRKNASLQALERLKTKIDPKAQVLVLFEENLHPGLISAIASRIAEEQQKITFVLTRFKGQITGSGRALEGNDMMAFLADFVPRLSRFGGHKAACGLGFAEEDFDDFKAYVFEKGKNLADAEAKLCLRLEEEDYTAENFAELFRYRPFGPQRELPTVYFDIPQPDSYGMLKNSHQLKWTYHGISLISFSNEGYDHYLGRPLKGYGKLKEEHYRNRVYYEIRIEELI